MEIIGHDFVRTMLSSDVLSQRTNRSFTQVIPDQIEQRKAQIAATEDASERARLETQLRIQEAHWEALQETAPTPPNLTYSDTMTLVKGGREVQLHFPGRGHTGGDTLVFLPEERIVFTGDFFVGRPGGHGLPYMGDGFVDEWPASLDRLKALEFDVMVPGHGTPFTERGQIDHLQAYLRDLNRQVNDLYAEGVSARSAAPARGPQRPHRALRPGGGAGRPARGGPHVRAAAGQDAPDREGGDKHGVTFAPAAHRPQRPRPPCRFRTGDHGATEERWLTLGQAANGTARGSRSHVS